MNITMTQTAKGAVTSTDVREFLAGREYDVPAELGEAFIGMGVADAVETKPAAAEVETKPAKSHRRKG